MVEHSGRGGLALAPLHGLLLGIPFPLALGGLLSDWAYSTSYQVQWINFADWLVAGSLAGGVLALAYGLLTTTLARRWGDRWSQLAALALVVFALVQFVNALTHSKDAYATMPAGLLFSLVATVLAFVAAWLGFRAIGEGAAR